MLSPAHVPLPGSPAASRRSSTSSAPYTSSPLASPHTPYRPRLDRFTTAATVKPEEDDSFKEGARISVNQPVGSISISPSSRDVCLASRKGLYILDLANLHNAPRFVPQGGTWQIADVQWSPHPATAHLILSTSSQKLLVWDLAAARPLLKSFDAHERAITDINWHALNPNRMATVSMDAGIRGWDLRCFDKPVMRLCDWGAAGTQVKWNRRHDHLVATAHGKIVHIWDDRKGSVPVTTIQAHDAKIYGIDWDRENRHKLVTCSLGKQNGQILDDLDYHSTLPAPSEPSHTIQTHYPVWRARHLPFGRGVLSLPQRGEKALEMFGVGDDAPVERFAGHENVVKDFVWRVRGGDSEGFDDREFQLVTWSKDRTLRIWPITQELEERVGWQHGAPITVLVSRRGAPDVTYTKDPSNTDTDAPKLPPPIVNPHPTQNQPSNLTRQKLAKPEIQPGMTRGGNKIRGMDQLEWLTKVVKNAPSPEQSLVSSRMPSRSRPPPGSRPGSRARSRSASVGGRKEWKSLKDELVSIDLAHLKLTISLQGPWANGDRQAFIRIHWSFPENYPYGPEIPTFELERNPTMSPLTRQTLVMTIKEMRAQNKQCLIETTGYLLGLHERQGRRRGIDESDSESERGEPTKQSDDVVPEMMLRKTCGATFGPNGQLVCFFPKQVMLPRTRNFSRSPSITRDNPPPMLRAMSALSRLQNPHHRALVRYKPRHRRLEVVESMPPPSGSTMTIYDVGHLGHPSAKLATVYGMSVDANMGYALDAKRLDHAEIWATIRGILADPPPAYTILPQVVGKKDDPRRERMNWEQGMERKRKVLHTLFSVLIQRRDIQLLALVSCIIHEYSKTMYIPPPVEAYVSHSPVLDYFTLRFPSHSSPVAATPAIQRASSSIVPLSPSNSSSFRTSGWSQILNPSGISLRGALTPKDKASFSDLPFAKATLGTSYEDQNSPTGLAIPGMRVMESPRVARNDKPKLTAAISPSPPSVAPLHASGPDKALATSGEPRSQKVSFGSASPIGRGARAHSSAGYHVGDPGNTGIIGPSTPTRSDEVQNKEVKGCGVKVAFPKDDSPSQTLLYPAMMAVCEAWKLAYADFLLRHNLLGIRTTLLRYQFIPHNQHSAVQAASGEVGGIVSAPDEEARIESSLSSRETLPKQSPSVTRGFARETLPSAGGYQAVRPRVVSGQNDPEPTEDARGRLTYASLVKLGAIKENLGLGSGSGDGGGSMINAGMSALGLHQDDDDEVGMERERTLRGEQRSNEQRGGDGLLSRAS
ncbi:hypothetical protein B9479_006699 [Cryptococcus floricola]|uniref:Uncharacterized protein n=1 Tax=Cryptococcus floricola TaxID=2591691 RepID=A0A5D3ARD3_9TREE|nr:hypothetical protein B9479_006699 [Cryptococcus floricola]